MPVDVSRPTDEGPPPPKGGRIANAQPEPEKAPPPKTRRDVIGPKGGREEEVKPRV